MATNNALVWRDMQSKLAAMGGVSQAVIGEPRSGVQSGMVAIIPQDGEIDGTVLNSWREVHAVTLRRYEAVEQQPGEDIELRLDEWRSEILEDVFGDFDLGGTIAHPLPAQMNWLYDSDEIGSHDFRILDVFVVYRIDPSGTFSA